MQAALGLSQLAKLDRFVEARKDNVDYLTSRLSGVEGDLTNTDIVMSWTFWVGVYPGLTRPMLDSLADSIHEYVAEAAR